MRYYILSLFVIGNLSLTTPIQAGEIISWVDQKGVTHFATTPPNGQTSVEEVHIPPTNKADVPTRALSKSVQAALSAVERNRSPATRSDVVIKGPPKKVLLPAARPSSKLSNRSYRSRSRGSSRPRT